MATFQVWSSEGVEMWMGEADDAGAALDAYAREAGYRDHADLLETIGAAGTDTTVIDVADVEEIAAAHLRGIEGGLVGAVAAVIAGDPLDVAAGLDGDDHWALPVGISYAMVRAEVRRQLREAVEEA